MNWGRLTRGILSGGLTELVGDRADNQYQGVDSNNFDLPGAGARQNYLQSMRGTTAPVARDSTFRNDQAALIRQLQARASGADSISRKQLERDAGANIAGQQALMQGGRPGQNAGLAAFSAAKNAGRIASGLSGNTALAGIAERNAAQDQLGGVLSSARGADNDLSKFNVSANQNQQQINQGWSAQDIQNAQAQQQGRMGYENNRTARFGSVMGAPTSGEAALGALSGFAQAAATKSDERSKKDISSGDASARAFMDSLKAKKFRYKNPADGAGTYTGVMAQDVEKSPAGRAAVIPTPTGKVVDFGRLGAVMTASLADLNSRTKKLEGKK